MFICVVLFAGCLSLSYVCLYVLFCVQGVYHCPMCVICVVLVAWCLSLSYVCLYVLFCLQGVYYCPLCVEYIVDTIGEVLTEWSTVRLYPGCTGLSGYTYRSRVSSRHTVGSYERICKYGILFGVFSKRNPYLEGIILCFVL